MFFLLPVTEGKPIPRQEAVEDTLRQTCMGLKYGRATPLQSQLFNVLSLLMTISQNSITEAALSYFLSCCHV